jgi:hypothetical protein
MDFKRKSNSKSKIIVWIDIKLKKTSLFDFFICHAMNKAIIILHALNIDLYKIFNNFHIISKKVPFTLLFNLK